MANISLKDIQFPGLNNVYKVPEVDNTLTQSGEAADAKKTGDEITALKQDYNQLSETKADKNSDNPNMGAGYASQLVSSLRKSDSVPYNFRKVPYDATLEDGGIVGASVAVNQLVQNGNFASDSNWSVNNGTKSVANNKLTLTATDANNAGIYQSVPTISGHKYLLSSDIKITTNASAVTMRWVLSDGGNGTTRNVSIPSGTKTNSSIMLEPTSNWSRLYFIGAFSESGMSVGDTIEYSSIMCFDLTQMLGTTIADYVYGLETATAGSGVAWLKEHFPKQFGGGYQAYNAGEIKSISGLAEHKSVGFNAWDEVWEVGGINNDTGVPFANNTQIRTKNFIHVLPGATYYFKAPVNGAACFYKANGDYIGYSYDLIANHTITIPDGIYLMKFKMISTYGTTYNHDICINISKTTGTPKNGDYVPYESHTYALDSTKTFRGILKLDSNNKLYADGDVYRSVGKKDERFGEVDLGTLTWTLNAANNWQSDGISSSVKRPAGHSGTDVPNIFLPGYTAVYDYGVNASGLVTISSTTGYIVLNNGSTTVSPTGHMIYELATPTTETALAYSNPQIINPDGTESYVYTDGAFELPVGHVSEYPVNVAGQLDDILDTPTTNGTYALQATVTDGAVSYEWVSTS